MAYDMLTKSFYTLVRRAIFVSGFEEDIKPPLGHLLIGLIQMQSELFLSCWGLKHGDKRLKSKHG